MVQSVYNIGMQLLQPFVRFSGLFNSKNRKLAKGWKSIWANLAEQLQKVNGPIIWFHCASLGEFEQARPIIEELKRSRPGYNICLTFFSPSGYEIRKSYELAEVVSYLPPDTPANAKHFIKYVQPALAVFVKAEFWANYSGELYRQNTPIFNIAGYFRPEQKYFGTLTPLYNKIFSRFNHFFVQDDESKISLEAHGGFSASVAGDPRVDRVLQLNKGASQMSDIADFCGGKWPIIAGSIWPEDLAVITETAHKLPADICWIMAPHNVNETIIKRIETALAYLNPVRYSNMTKSVQVSRLLIIDNIGMLQRLYQYGKIAYIGGSFKTGLHNTLEPAAAGLPVIFGNKKYFHFNEAVTLAELGCFFPIANSAALINKILMLYEQPEKLVELSETITKYLNLQSGATTKIVARLLTQLPA